MQAERRKHPRTKPDSTFRFTCYNADFEEHPLHRTNLALKAVDISAKGLCIVTSGRLRAGVTLMVLIDVPDSDVRFRGKAVVRWSQTLHHQGREAHVAGVELTQVLEARGEKVRFLASNMRDRTAETQRQHARIMIDSAEVLCLPDGLWSSLGFSSNAAKSLVDLSESGCQIISLKKLEPGQHVKLRISFKRPDVVVQASGEVRWSRRDTLTLEPRYPTGIQFRELSRDDEARLRLAMKGAGAPMG
jgi:hypothetical protein